MSVFDAKNPYHHHLIPINIKTGVVLNYIKEIDTEKHIIDIILTRNKFKTLEEIDKYLSNMFGKYRLLNRSFDYKLSLFKITIHCENVRVITKDDDPYDFIQCPNYMDFRFFKEKVIPAMKVARGLGTPISIETFKKYCKYPRRNFHLEKGY